MPIPKNEYRHLSIFINLLVLFQHHQRVNSLAIIHHYKMQMTASALAGGANITNNLTGLNCIASFNRQAGQMGITSFPKA